MPKNDAVILSRTLISPINYPRFPCFREITFTKKCRIPKEGKLNSSRKYGTIQKGKRFHNMLDS